MIVRARKPDRYPMAWRASFPLVRGTSVSMLLSGHRHAHTHTIGAAPARRLAHRILEALDGPRYWLRYGRVRFRPTGHYAPVPRRGR